MGLSGCPRIVQILLVLLNSLSAVVSLGLCLVGLMGLFNNDSNTPDDMVDSLRRVSVFVCVFGLFCVITSIVGCFSAGLKKIPGLTAYAILVSILFFVQLIVAIIYTVNSHEVLDSYEIEQFESVAEHYGQMDEAGQNKTREWDTLQIQLQCCGVSNGPEDWLHTNWYIDNNLSSEEIDSIIPVPHSCCVDQDDLINCYAAAEDPSYPNREQYVHVKGCMQSPSFDVKALTIIYIILAVQVLIFGMACYLRYSVKKAKNMQESRLPSYDEALKILENMQESRLPSYDEALKILPAESKVYI